MPLSIFNSLSLGPLQSIDVVIHLANRSVAYPAGFIEDVLVRVDELIFPVDFYVLDMESVLFRKLMLLLLVLLLLLLLLLVFEELATLLHFLRIC